MKFINVFFLAFAIMAFGTSCNNTAQTKADPADQQAAEQSLWDSMMVIHDEVMPMMTSVEKIKQILNEQKGVVTGEEQKSIVKVALSELDAADKGMWEWMHNLQKLADLRKDKSHDEIMTYLTEQTNAISKVQDDILTSIQNGEKAIDSLGGHVKK